MLSPGKVHIPRPSRQWVLAMVLVQLMIWTIIVGLALFGPRKYTSSWKLILPGSEPEARVSLQDVGQASASTRAFYDGRALDHRVNYREIARSAPVLATAAGGLGLEWKELKGQRVRLVDQSSIMEFEVSGPTADTARERAWALYQALQGRLSELRENELEERKLAIEYAVEEARRKMEGALDRVEEFKIDSGLVSDEQVDGMIRTTLELQSLRVQTEARLAFARTRLRGVASGLRLTPDSATDAVALLSDRAYRATLERYTEAKSEIDAARGRWAAKHPRRVALEARTEGAGQALVEIASERLGRSVTRQEIDSMNRLVGLGEATQLFETLAEALADSQSLSAEAASLSRQEGEMRARLGELGRQHSQLENLERRLALSEAVFNSTLGKADVGRLSVFASYPLVQLLAEPGRPDVASSPRVLLLVAGGLVASVASAIGLILLWLVAPSIRNRALGWVADASRTPGQAEVAA